MTRSILERVRSGDALLLQEEMTDLISRPGHAPGPDWVWVQLVVPLMLVRCTRKAVSRVAPRFLIEYPTPLEFVLFAYADGASPDRTMLVNTLHEQCGFGGLGMETKRFDFLLSVAERLCENGAPRTREEVLEIKGVGEYVADSYCIFVLGDRTIEPADRVLTAYLDRASSR